MNCEELLGFNIIKQRLSEHCGSKISKEMALNLEIGHNASQIADNLAETAEAILSLNTEVEQPLGGTRDIRLALSKTEKNIILTREEIWDVFITIDAYNRMKKFFTEKYLYYPSLSLWMQDMGNMDHVSRKLGSIFDKKGEIIDTASVKLHQLRNSIYSLKDRIKRELNGIIQNKDNHKYFQENIVTLRNDRYVIPVKSEYRHAFYGIMHDKSATGATLYIEPMSIVKLNNDLNEAIIEEERELLRIFKEMSQYICQNSNLLLDSCQRVSHVEFVYGKASFALSYKGIVGKISPNRHLLLINAKHPLLDPQKVVPSTIELGNDYNVLLITGSNTGGKTVSLKTTGLIAMMHQAGLCIPCDEGTELPVFGQIYADIGDDQSIEENLSTFSGHIKQIKYIIDNVNDDDLVLIDELGSGTDPEEGSALAVAIMEDIYKRNCFAMITTHYNELKNYAYETEHIQNAHVEFDEESLQPTYKLRIGVAGSSHAFSIAERLGLPKEIIQKAREQKSSSRFNDMETILAKLNEQLRQAEIQEEKLKRELAQAKKLHENARRELKNIEDKKKSILDKAKDDAYNLKRNIRQESEAIIKELKSQFSQKDNLIRSKTIQEVRQMVDDIAIPEVIEKRAKVKLNNLSVGSVVFVNTLQSVGIVKAIDGKRIKVEVNGLEINLKPNDVAQATENECEQGKIKQKKIEKAVSKTTQMSAAYRQGQVSTELKILGQTVDEACVNVERFIDQALLAGLSSVKIIHGKGTGSLRQGVREHLKNLRHVKNFGDAAYNDGGAGATIVNLK